MNIFKAIYYGIKRIFYKGRDISIEEKIYIKEAAIREVRWEIEDLRFQISGAYRATWYLVNNEKIYRGLGNHYMVAMARLEAKKRRLEKSLKGLKKAKAIIDKGEK